MDLKQVYDASVETIDGKRKAMADYKGKVLLIVNTASQCGFTPQYAGLGDLYTRYRERGFEVLAFPCNQFGNQEPGSAEEIQQFCDLNFKVNFPLFAKVDVNGEQASPLFKFLKKEAKGVMGTEAVKWNFTKFLVDRQGKVVSRFAPQAKPQDLAPHIEALLEATP